MDNLYMKMKGESKIVWSLRNNWDLKEYYDIKKENEMRMVERWLYGRIMFL